MMGSAGEDILSMSMLCSVGDLVRFGQSSRMFLVSGPQELMPEEGLSKRQQHQLRVLEVGHTSTACQAISIDPLVLILQDSD